MTGAVIALVVRQPAIAIPLSFASHFICDAIPHYGMANDRLFSRKFNAVLLGDFLFAVSLMAALAGLFPAERWLIWTCMIAAASPDLMWAYYKLYREHIQNKPARLDPLARFHSWIQWSQTRPGLMVEVAWFLTMAGLLARLHQL
jgi:hypothetical protein